MQDWSMIPLHIRCTERYKIDPNYPDDGAKWWRFSEDRARRPGEGRFYVGSRIPLHVTEYAAQAGAGQLVDIAGALKVPVKALEGSVRTHRRFGFIAQARRIDFMTEQEIAKDPYLCKTRQAVIIT